MDDKYFAWKIERKWQKRWKERRTFEAKVNKSREKFYCLEMLPYPSGQLHMGHVRNYSIGDVLSWYKRLRGFNVLHPIGWDSFGQPAEQAAIKHGINPRDWTEENINEMRRQLQRLGFSYDWSREIAAHHSNYYKFDQWFFLKMMGMGLAYRKDSDVNWCAKCGTTLSNEQALGGICWRCGLPVGKKTLPQWFLKITDYAEELLSGMNEIEEGWAERVLTMQRNWINRSEGAFINFKIVTDDGSRRSDNNSTTVNIGNVKKYIAERVEKVCIFTTRVDTIYGANAIILAPEHPLVNENYESFSDEVKAKIKEIQAEQAEPTTYGEEIEKDGIDLGLKALNPFNGEEIPVWVGNYVMMSYGTGAVMSVPAHDERDFEFAKKFDLPVRKVVKPKSHRVAKHEKLVEAEPQENAQKKPEIEKGIDEAFSGYGVLINSDAWNGKTSEEAMKEMTSLAEENGFGKAAVTYRLRDWCISRQRFWGSPIPIIYCDSCGVVPVPVEDLPVKLPEYAPFTGGGESPLKKVEEFLNTSCPSCGARAKRETDTMDTFADSSWYYFRYCDPHNKEAPFDSGAVDYWMPVDQYIGGIDHAVMHLLYTRYWSKVARDLHMVNFDEPIKSLLTQGMVVNESFYSKANESYVSAEEVDIKRAESGKVLGAKLKSSGSDVRVAIEKMSKSKLNGVNPSEMISIYGADAVRLFSLFAAPVENELVWQEKGIDGASRFLQKVWRYILKWKDFIGKKNVNEAITSDNQTSHQHQKKSFANTVSSDGAKRLRQKTHQTIKRVTESFESGQFNTPVAALMELYNVMSDFKLQPKDASDGDLHAIKEACESLTLMLAPYAPHISEELWEVITGSDTGILASEVRFPIADEKIAKAEMVEIVIQVNGKLRSRVKAPSDSTKEDLENFALADAKIKEYTDEKEIVKIIVVLGRLVNVVVK